eukprot:TRINITY_DN60687_c0_g1_i1.p1 TRINITY_DN60687_c0_g1~~TRINITY_DN60687_c0_g1_i1.p1  ORF type:complete len:62 (-),score=3.74 TRINITY_DN60687_c0_g1_i1:99-284(-)
MGIKLTTVREGERVVIWKDDGTYKTVDGPSTIRTLNTVQPLVRHTANKDQYLEIIYKSGEK